MQEDPGISFDRFELHFGTNYAPTETEVAELRAILEVPDGQIRALDEEIAHRETQLYELRKRREALKDSTKNHRALLSPIRRIPVDLLQDIFIACLPAERYPSMSSDEAPMLLTQVSTQWRQVAHLTPRLWAAIHIPAPSTPVPLVDAEIDRKHLKVITHQRIEAVNIWFQRSGLCPLRISLHEWFGNQGTSSISEFLTKCLVPVCRRWKDLSLTAYAEYLYPIQELNNSQMPLLESLHLSFKEETVYWGTAEPCPWHANGILGCQHLTSLKISADTEDIPWDIVKWGQLTTLMLDTSRESSGWDTPPPSIIPRMKSALRKATTLTSLTLHTGRTLRADERMEEDYQPIELPFLEHLDIEGNDGTSLLPYLHTPLVRSVSYRRNGKSDPGPSPLLQFLNSNVGTEIGEFVTNNQSMSAKDLVDCLQLCPSLRSLHVNTPTPPPRAIQPVTYNPFATNCALSNDLLTLIAPTSPWDTNEILCPKLEDIEFLAYEAKFSEATIVDFIERKQCKGTRGLSKLRVIKVALGKKNLHDKNVMVDLKSHIDAGLKVEFRYPPADSIVPLSLYDGSHLASGTGF